MNNADFLKFKKLLNFAVKNTRSDFYRAKYGQAGFDCQRDLKSTADIAKIPLLTKKELSDAPPDKLLFLKEEDAGHISRTSGTTGKPLLTFRPKQEKSTGFETIKGVDFGRAMILANPFQAGKLYMKIKSKTKYALVVGDIHKLSESCLMAAHLQIKTLLTTATLAVILKEYLQKHPEFQKSLKYFLLSGELVTPAKKKLLKELYPNADFFVSYGTGETGPIAFQCSRLSKKDDAIMFHPRLADYHFEIVNPDNRQAAGFDEKGEVILTDFWNNATPLIRYKTGDMASFHKNDCSCGAPGPLLQLWGRINHDFVRAGGFEIRKDMLEKPLLNLRSYVREGFEAHIYETFINTKPRIKIALNLSLKNGVAPSPGLKKKILDEFMENCRLSPGFNLKAAVEAGLFEPPQINFVEFPLSAKAQGILILH